MVCLNCLLSPEQEEMRIEDGWIRWSKCVLFHLNDDILEGWEWNSVNMHTPQHFITILMRSDASCRRLWRTVKVKHTSTVFVKDFPYGLSTQWGSGDCNEIMPGSLCLRRMDSSGGQRSNLRIEETFASVALSYVNQRVIVPIPAANELLIDFYAIVPELCIHESHF